MSAATVRLWSLAEDHCTLGPQPRERRGRRVSSGGLMVRPATWCWRWPSTSATAARRTLSARFDGAVPCREHAASEVHGVTGWCVPTSMMRRSAGRRHSAQTAICPKGAQRRMTRQSCSNQPCWSPVHEPRSTRFDASRNAARYGSDAVLQSTNRQLQRLRPHDKVAVNMDTEVADRRDWWNHGAAVANRPDWDLMSTALGRAPQDFCLAGVELQLVGPHPWWHVVNASGNSALQADGLEKATKPIDLYHG